MTHIVTTRDKFVIFTFKIAGVCDHGRQRLQLFQRAGHLAAFALWLCLGHSGQKYIKDQKYYRTNLSHELAISDHSCSYGNSVAERDVNNVTFAFVEVGIEWPMSALDISARSLHRPMGL